MLNPVQKYKADALKINVCQSAEELAIVAAADAQKFLRAALSVKGKAGVVLATGNSQILFLEHLTAATGIDWSRVTLFHMDEYLGIPADHSASFRRYLKERVEDKVHPRAFHYLKGDALEPISECLRYEALLTTTGVDLVCMGIGENGHLAFNDPPVANFKDQEGVKIVKLDDACRTQQVGEGHFPSLDAVPQYALTLTIPQLDQGRPRAVRRAGKTQSRGGKSRGARADRDGLPGLVSAQTKACDAVSGRGRGEPRGFQSSAEGRAQLGLYAFRIFHNGTAAAAPMTGAAR